MAKVLQFSDLNPTKVKAILEKYGKEIGMSHKAPGNKVLFDGAHKTVPTAPLDALQFLNKKYCLLIFLKNPAKIKPFEINKKGFGMMSAWITVKNIRQIRK